MKRWSWIPLCVLVVTGGLACGGSSNAKTDGSTDHAAALALYKAVSFVGGSLQDGAIPDSTAPGVTLAPAVGQAATPGATDALLGFDLTNPDEASDPAAFALLQFGDVQQHIRVKLGASVGDAGSVSGNDGGSAAMLDAGGPAADGGGSQTSRMRQVVLHYSVAASVCDQLCDTSYALQVVQAVSRKHGSVSAHAQATFTLDCTDRGNHALCAADTAAAGGSSMAGPMGAAATSSDGVLAVVVSPGAVTGAPIALSIQPATTKLPKGTIGPVYELGPTGTKFAKPVALEYSYARVALGSTDPKSLRLATLDVSGTKWQALPANQVDTARQVVTGDTTHFSPFGLIAGGSSAVADAGSGGGGGGTGTLSFSPSNVDLSGLDLSKVGDVSLSGNSCDIYSESQMWPCVDDTMVAKKIVTLPDQSRVSLFVVKSLRIEPSTVVHTYEHLPIVVVALDSMTLLGSILVQPGTAGGAFNSGTQSSVKGQGPGGGAAGTTDAAGGGGSFCGLGGRGATEGTAAGAKTPAYGSPTLVPLQGGSAGGTGDLVDSNGGGAIQLVAGTTFLLGPNAYVSAGGSGGVNGGTNHQEASGGGSGGAILIEAPTVMLSGVLAVNGAGGGQGNGESGANASADDHVAPGGRRALSGSVPSPGGDGSAAAVTNGTDGTDTPGSAAGGGGGGAGRIRINTMDGTLDTTKATLSPAKGSSCWSVGKLAP